METTAQRLSAKGTDVNLLVYIFSLLLIGAVSVALGVVVGWSKGDDEGYARGYHEGGFDAVHMPDHYKRNDTYYG